MQRLSSLVVRPHSALAPVSTWHCPEQCLPLTGRDGKGRGGEGNDPQGRVPLLARGRGGFPEEGPIAAQEQARQHRRMGLHASGAVRMKPEGQWARPCGSSDEEEQARSGRGWVEAAQLGQLC